jgi:hypothetical protein
MSQKSLSRLAVPHQHHRAQLAKISWSGSRFAIPSNNFITGVRTACCSAIATCREVGWAKGLELAKIALEMGRILILQPGAQTREMPKDRFK